MTHPESQTKEGTVQGILEPVVESHRISSVDVLRGVAVCGILLMNIVGMGLPDPAYWDPSFYGGSTGWNLLVWQGNSLFIEGSMRALFSLLFGAGVLLFTAKGTLKDAGISVADAWYRRTIWLIIFGMVHAYFLLWPGDVLYMYGLMGMFLFPFRNVRPSRLLILGMALLVAGAVLAIFDSHQAVEKSHQAAQAQELIVQGQEVTEVMQAGLDAWNEKLGMMKPSLESQDREVRNLQAGYLSAWKQRSHYTYWMESEYHYRYSYFDILGMMFLGMALFKWRVLQAGLATRGYVLMIAVGYSLGFTINWIEMNTYLRSGFDLVVLFQMAQTYDLGRMLTMTGHLGLVMLACRMGWARWLVKRVEAVGRMALTNYLMHTVITTTVFVGLAQYGRWERHQLYFLVLAIWIFQLVVSPIWLRHYYYGPMEWVWRSLTYLKQPAFVRRLSRSGPPNPIPGTQAS